MIKIIVVRHGETIENKQRIIQGQSEGYLSEYGIERNKELGEVLKNNRIDKIFTSTLIRAKETAIEIHKNHSQVQLETTDKLKEWNLGMLQGKVYPDNFDITSNWEGKENPESVKKRLSKFLNEIISQHQNQTILLVSHGLTIKVLTTILNNLPLDDIYTMELMDNSSFRVFNLENIQNKQA